MENIGRLFGQVAAEAGCTQNRAKVATYLLGLTERGSSVGDAAKALRRKPDTIKVIAREFLIDFSDYRPFARDRDAGIDIPARIKLHLSA